MSDFRLKRGYDISLAGAAPREFRDAPAPSAVAIRPTDFLGVRPKLEVAVGDPVKAGSPLFHAKAQDDFKFTAPLSGRVTAINRGPRRVIQSIVIEADGKNEAETFPAAGSGKIADLSREKIMALLLRSGLFACFRQRPFARTASPEDTPRDIFVSALDTAPLAADPVLLVQGNEESFQAGLDVCARLTSGSVQLSLSGSRGDLPAALTQADNVITHRFSGPHPAGNVGVQIHHVAPIRNRGDIVWTVTVQGLIWIGRLFLEGRLAPATVVAIAGSAATNPGYYQTVMGAPAAALLNAGGGTGNVAPVAPGETRVISGDVLSGANIGREGFLGFHDNLITVIPEVTEPEFIGWMLPGGKKRSIWPAFAANFLGRGRKMVQNTCRNGSLRNFIVTGKYEEVLPLDIHAEYLLKSILYQDIEEMEGLGIYEVAPEDFALCEYICPSKIEIQQLVRAGLDYVEREG